MHNPFEALSSKNLLNKINTAGHKLMISHKMIDPFPNMLKKKLIWSETVIREDTNPR